MFLKYCKLNKINGIKLTFHFILSMCVTGTNAILQIGSTYPKCFTNIYVVVQNRFKVLQVSTWTHSIALSIYNRNSNK